MNKILISCLVLFACNSSQEPLQVPADLMEPALLHTVLMDIHLMEAYVGEMRLPEDSLTMVLPSYYLEIFERHGTTKEVFFDSFHFYVEHPAALDSVYEGMLDSLKLMQINKLK